MPYDADGNYIRDANLKLARDHFESRALAAEERIRHLESLLKQYGIEY